jgi:hypothetical protein
MLPCPIAQPKRHTRLVDIWVAVSKLIEFEDNLGLYCLLSSNKQLHPWPRVGICIG